MSLTISIHSFSYKVGYPEDLNGNGGGFVFDCRGIYNPGRIDGYKALSGLDQEVQDFLQKQSAINDFLNPIYEILSLTITNYLERDFEHLQVNFGCTGGQHRSVYSAEQTAKYIKERFPKAIVKVKHLNKHQWKK